MGGGLHDVGSTGGRVSILPDLNARLLRAHAENDVKGLAGLYGQAADMAGDIGDGAGECFFLTHAWVFALDGGLPSAGVFEKRLAGLGCV